MRPRRDWDPAREMRPVLTLAARDEARADGLRICEYGHGAWHPEVWGECPVCSEETDPMAQRRRLREEAEDAAIDTADALDSLDEWWHRFNAGDCCE